MPNSNWQIVCIFVNQMGEFGHSCVDSFCCVTVTSVEKATKEWYKAQMSRTKGEMHGVEKAREIRWAVGGPASCDFSRSVANYFSKFNLKPIR